MPYNLLLLPLMGGFLFLHVNHYFRFHAQRMDGYRMLIESAVAGCILGFIAKIVVSALTPTALGKWTASLWDPVFPWPDANSAAMALALGPVLGLAGNLFVDRERAKDLEMAKHGNSLTSFLHRAERSGSLISVTLDSRKWYVGYVIQSPNLSPTDLYFRILPVISGYRDKDTLEPVETVLYEEAIMAAPRQAEDFVMTIPLGDVKVANLFDIGVYETYFANGDEGDETDTSVQ